MALEVHHTVEMEINKLNFFEWISLTGKRGIHKLFFINVVNKSIAILIQFFRHIEKKRIQKLFAQPVTESDEITLTGEHRFEVVSCCLQGAATISEI